MNNHRYLFFESVVVRRWTKGQRKYDAQELCVGAPVLCDRTEEIKQRKAEKVVRENKASLEIAMRMGWPRHAFRTRSAADACGRR